MRIGFGTTVLTLGLQRSSVDGIATYTAALLERLRANPTMEVIPVSYGTNFPQGDPRGQRSILQQYFPFYALRACLTGMNFPGTKQLAKQIDLFHATDHFVPRMGSIPVIATLMDALPLAHPEWVASPTRAAKNFLWKKTAQWARHVITISEFSKQEIVTHFGIRPEKISVIPLGVDPEWFTPLAEEERRTMRQKYDLPDQFYVFVGTLQPRKNVARLIEAHRLMPEEKRRETPLVIIGRAGWQSEDVVAALTSGDAYLRWLDYVPKADLQPLVKSATALVFPSLYEGFGLPVLEAFAASVPVITSNSTSLPEVAGDAALLVDPTDARDIASAMQKITASPAYASDLVAKGLARAQTHSWDETMRKTLEVYRMVAASGMTAAA